MTASARIHKLRALLERVEARRREPRLRVVQSPSAIASPSMVENTQGALAARRTSDLDHQLSTAPTATELAPASAPPPVGSVPAQAHPESFAPTIPPPAEAPIESVAPAAAAPSFAPTLQVVVDEEELAESPSPAPTLPPQTPPTAIEAVPEPGASVAEPASSVAESVRPVHVLTAPGETVQPGGLASAVSPVRVASEPKRALPASFGQLIERSLALRPR